MPRSRKNNPSFPFYFNDLKKLVKIMISCKYKETFSNEASMEVVKANMKKKTRQKKGNRDDKKSMEK